MECLRELEQRLGIKPLEFREPQAQIEQPKPQEQPTKKPDWRNIRNIQTRNLAKKLNVPTSYIEDLHKQLRELDCSKSSRLKALVEAFGESLLLGTADDNSVNQSIKLINKQINGEG